MFYPLLIGIFYAAVLKKPFFDIFISCNIAFNSFLLFGLFYNTFVKGQDAYVFKLIVYTIASIAVLSGCYWIIFNVAKILAFYGSYEVTEATTILVLITQTLLMGTFSLLNMKDQLD